jgi:hypothetical protein
MISLGERLAFLFLPSFILSQQRVAFLREWRTQTRALQPDVEVKAIDVLAVTQSVLSDLGEDNVVESLNDEEWGTSAREDLNRLWVSAIADEVRLKMMEESPGKPVLSIEHISALYPASGPWDVMQRLWNDAELSLDCPVIVLIPGDAYRTRGITASSTRRTSSCIGEICYDCC